MIIVQADEEEYDLFKIEKVKQGQTDHKTAIEMREVKQTELENRGGQEKERNCL